MSQVAIKGSIYAYERLGNGKKTPLLILHGWGRSKEEWLEVGAELAVGREVYVLDLPGFGGSTLPSPVESIKEYAELVVEFCQYMKLVRVIVIGHSLGGRVGIVLGARWPKMVEKLVLIDPAGVKPRSIKRVGLKLVAKLFGWVPKSWRARLIEPMMDEDYRKIPAMRALYRSVVGEDLRAYLPTIESETTVIWGENDQILPLSLTKVYREKLRNCRVRVAWRSGHDPHLTHARELVRILEEVWT